jgi:hypothetical protein
MEEHQYAVGDRVEKLCVPWARRSLAQQARSGFARELPAMWRKHRIQKRQNADGRPRLN